MEENVKYMNVESVTETIKEIYTEKVNEYNDEKYGAFLIDRYDDDTIAELAEILANQLNSDMRDYLHKKDHKIFGNFNNIDYDYPAFREGDGAHYNQKLVDNLIKRLDENAQDEQTKADRELLLTGSGIHSARSVSVTISLQC